jgi:tetratricopeptide (TPR) repeat protein
MERTLEGVGTATAAAGAVLLAATVALTVLLWRRGQWRAAMGLVWFLMTWLPISGIFPLNAPMAEHWMYMPMAGLLWAAAELAWAFAQKPAARYAAVAAAYGLAVVFLALTVARNRDWHDNERIFLATLDKNPDSTRVRYNLAVTYEDLLHNPWAARRHYEGVIASYREQKREMLGGGKEEFWDEELESHLSLGTIYADRRQYGDAAEYFSTVMRVAPNQSNGPMRATAAFGLGQCFWATGDSRNALELFKQAAAGRPELKGEIERLLAGQR